MIGSAWLFFAGTIIVADPGNSASEAWIYNSVERRSLARFAGRFVGIPSLEGGLKVQCRNGRQIELGYVTGAFHVRERLEGRLACSHPVASARK